VKNPSGIISTRVGLLFDPMRYTRDEMHVP